ncbi:unnamed protein product [Gordionus sp. m RMFG-2023]|uniref:peptidyl-prolyl cis-trans isomerase D-like n=1 Tax=Gordionus sp. m RMFG-2023 TaxID=3053472 RepID=UPI0030E419FB
MDVDKIITRPQVFLEIAISDIIIGKIIIELFDDVCPKICEHFLALCSGFSRLEPENSPETLNTENSYIFYKGSKINTIYPDKYIHIGALNPQTNLKDHYNIADASKLFPNLLNKIGLLCIIDEREKNGNYFYIITTCPLSLLNGCQYFIFGHIYKGMGVVKQIQELETLLNGSPLKECKINDCGIHDVTCSDNSNTIGDHGIRDMYAEWPEDELNNSNLLLFTNVQGILSVVTHIKYFGKILFKKQNYDSALQKYAKALRYLNAFLEYSSSKAIISHEQNDAIMKLISTCILNSSACKIKMSRFEEAIHDCDEALDLDPRNPRIYLRKAQSYHGLSLYPQAVMELQKGLTLKPHDKAMMAEMIAIKGEMSVYKIQS